MASSSDPADANAGGAPAPSISSVDRDIAIRTMIGEAGNQGLDGQAGVGSVMLNRLAAGSYGKTLSAIAFAKNQFEPWTSRADELMGIDASSPSYQQAAHVFDGLTSGTIPDITMGATHFYAPGLQASLGRSTPTWAQGQGIPIGGHVFFAPNGPVPAKGGNATSAINAATGQTSQPPSDALGYTGAPASAPASSMSDDDIDSLYVGAPKSAKASPVAPAQPATTAPAPPNIAFQTQAPWESSAKSLTPQAGSPATGMSDSDIDAMYAGSKASAAPTPTPTVTKDGVRDPQTGELVVGGKGFTPDSDYWGGFRNMANGALLGAGVPLSAATAALKEKLWDGSPLSLSNLYDQAHDTYAGGRQSYQAEHPVASAVTEGAGNLLTTIPATMTGGAVLGVAGRTALGEMQSLPMLSRLAPAAEGIGNFVSGSSKGNLLTTLGSRGAAGAAQGAAAGAMSAGLGDQSIGDAALQGAAVGGAIGGGLPALVGTGKYAKNALTSLSQPFTDAGTSRLAQAPLQNAIGDSMPGNLNELITGSRPTFAEAYPNANAATIQRTARDLNPQPFVAREAANNAARNAHLANLTGSPQDVEAAEAALDTNAHNAIATLFKPGQTADAQPVVNTIDSILNGSGGKRDAVRSVMNNIRSKLVDGDGTVEQDPQTLYDSVRKQIGDLLDKRATTSDPAGQQASRELMQVRDSLDGAITKAVPGFDQYLTDYSAAKQPIDAMKFMQGLNLTDTQGNTTLSKVDSALKNIAKLRMADGTNAAKSLTDDHIDGLSALRDDLLRQTNTGLGRSAGSSTGQNLATQNMLNTILPGKAGAFVGSVARPEVIGGAIGTFLGNHLGGYYGAAAGGGVGAGLGRMASDTMQRRGALVRSKLDNLLLDPGSYTPTPTGSGGQYLPIQRLPGGVVPLGLTLRNELLQPSSQ